MQRARRVLFTACAITALGLGGDAVANGPAESPHPIAGMQSWATAVAEIARGPRDIADPGGPLASYGAEADVVGPALGDTFTVLSLGDGGWATLYLEAGIGDGPGDDFAVFENGFWTAEGLFGEYAFVEVSTDGVVFVRMETLTLQVGPIESTDPCDYDGFAGDQPFGLGTGFDLAELSAHPLVMSGDLDLHNVHYVRVVDVIGNGSELDSFGNPVHDPYPTGHPSGGFDLDGVGALHLAVPEPNALSLGASALALLVALHRRRCARLQ